MEKAIREEIVRFVMTSPENLQEDGATPYFEEPLVGFAAADDPLFIEYKKIIGDFHLTPGEFLSEPAGASSAAQGTVISWVLPLTAVTRKSNRVEDLWPSRAWARTRHFGEVLNCSLRRHVVDYLQQRGSRAVAPQLSERWKPVDAPDGPTSSWSERHAAYAAGLGTFSLNDALITPKGIAHRLGSVITDLKLSPTPVTAAHYRWNCLRFRDGGCGVCINRCPVGALSDAGHDKEICRNYVYGTVPRTVGEQYGVTATGCGLCQVKIPCEEQIP
ncbi:epoxyqueuosine reductase [Desulfuromonas sp. TF]|uniref:epoxyqueuosine reductase n=1 Tax=Desulfuromonas sp. TF TaxID=1232410 RepID=UPI00041F5F18|nr:epoxyqueuosine reductase [Desulfuromonas sp. TF]